MHARAAELIEIVGRHGFRRFRLGALVNSLGVCAFVDHLEVGRAGPFRGTRLLGAVAAHDPGRGATASPAAASATATAALAGTFWCRGCTAGACGRRR